jgi:spermidine synthase
MPPRLNQFLVGQPAKRTFANRASKFFFTELDKGIESPYVLLASGVFFSYLAWKVTDHYVRPRQEQLAQRRPIQRVPFEQSHNAFWGFSNADDRATPAARTQVAEVEDVGGNLYLPQGSNEGQEEAMRRPQLLFSEASELHERATAANPTGEVDLVCLELSEYDASLRDDVYYRSVHYVPNVIEPGALTTTTSSPSSRAAKCSTSKSMDAKTAEPTDGLWKRMVSPLETAAAAMGKSDSKNGSSTTTATAASSANVEKIISTSDYLQFMPGQGEEVVHGMIKCKGVTTQNNCVPYPGHLEEEYARKLMLTLGPVHILRDPAKTTIPMRFSFVKQVPIETLVLGMHSGEMPRWLSTCYPNFHVNVVEKDGTLVRLCKRFLGFQESSNLTVEVADPVEFVKQYGVLTRHAAAGGGSGNDANVAVKPYDLVLIDGIDGAGKLSTQYGRLEFISNVRNLMSGNGCVAMTLPNKDAGFVFNMVQNWRMAFAGRPVLLIHCATSPCTILMTFQDAAARGKTSMGSVANVWEFQDLLRAHVRHYGADRMQFDITREVNAKNFSVLEPEQTYGVESYLPAGHPAVLEARHQEVEAAMRRKNRNQGWNARLRRWTGTGLSPSQRADLMESEK